MKRLAGSVEGTPEKRSYLAIIKEYNLEIGVCELIDNAIDTWISRGRIEPLKIKIEVDPQESRLTVEDNAGGVDESKLHNLIRPGASEIDGNQATIGFFGVGSKRAAVALAKRIRFTTRAGSGKTFFLEYDEDWIKEDDWHIDYYEVDPTNPNSTKVELTELRHPIDNTRIQMLSSHLSCVYAKLLTKESICLVIGKDIIAPRHFDTWSYPAGYSPQNFQGTIKGPDQETVQVSITAGLSDVSGYSNDLFGAFFYCNNRLIEKGATSNEVGFYRGYAGAPHHSHAICKVIVELLGPSKLMPWNSSKTKFIFGQPGFEQVQERIKDLISHYAKISKNLVSEWEDSVFPNKTGTVAVYETCDFGAILRSKLPAIPNKRVNYSIELVKANKQILENKPWADGHIDSMVLVEALNKVKVKSKNRALLVLLDSDLEIAMKDFLVHESGAYYSDSDLVKLFAHRHLVVKELKKYTDLPEADWKLIKYFYDLRCKLVHEKATALISDDDIIKYRYLVQKVLRILFGLKFISPSFRG